MFVLIFGTYAGRDDEVPVIGNNVYIGPETKIFGKIYVSDNIMIGVNVVVNKSFYEPNITIAGIPADKVSNKGVMNTTNKDRLCGATILSNG